MFDLEDGGLDTSIALEIKEQSTVIVTVEQDIVQPYVGTRRGE